MYVVPVCEVSAEKRGDDLGSIVWLQSVASSCGFVSWLGAAFFII